MPAGFKNSRKLWTNGQDPNIPVRLLNLENNEYKITYYEIISGTSGSITLPTGATINAGEFGLSGNCILSKIDGSNKPTFESPKTSGGTIVTASLNETTGAWVASGTYTDANVALIYSIKIKAVYYSNLTYDRIIETTSDSATYMVDLSATLTIVGWSTFTTKQITKIDCGSYNLWDIHLDGTSNSTTTTVDLVDVTNANSTIGYKSIVVVDNGGAVSATGVVNLTPSSSIVTFTRNLSQNLFTASGRKLVIAQIIQMK